MSEFAAIGSCFLFMVEHICSALNELEVAPWPVQHSVSFDRSSASPASLRRRRPGILPSRPFVRRHGGNREPRNERRPQKPHPNGWPARHATPFPTPVARSPPISSSRRG